MPNKLLPKAWNACLRELIWHLIADGSSARWGKVAWTAPDDTGGQQVFWRPDSSQVLLPARPRLSHQATGPDRARLRRERTRRRVIAGHRDTYSARYPDGDLTAIAVNGSGEVNSETEDIVSLRFQVTVVTYSLRANGFNSNILIVCGSLVFVEFDSFYFAAIGKLLLLDKS